MYAEINLSIKCLPYAKCYTKNFMYIFPFSLHKNSENESYSSLLFCYLTDEETEEWTD
jgi:hypothetical protein